MSAQDTKTEPGGASRADATRTTHEVVSQDEWLRRRIALL